MDLLHVELVMFQPFQPLCQSRVALPVHDAFDRHPNGLDWAHQDGELLGSCESGVHQIATE